MQQDKGPRFIGGAGRATDVERLSLAPQTPIIAFAGRSNVGKSSLINALMGAKIARVSKTPGKTREINFYVKSSLVLADLPGYGYARVEAELREFWGREITAWLQKEERLGCVCVLVDGRHGFQDSDLECVQFLHAGRIPHVAIFTKMDKWKTASAMRSAEKQWKESAARLGMKEDEVFFVSSQKHIGMGALKAFLHKMSQGISKHAR